MIVPLRILLPRTATFLAVAAFIIGGPLWTQGLDRPSRVLSDWTMFSGYGLDVWAVRYLQASPDGTLIPLDRYALLGYGSKVLAPLKVQRVKDLEEATSLARKLCRVLPPGADVRMWLKKPTATGWKQISRPKENLCAPR